MSAFTENDWLRGIPLNTSYYHFASEDDSDEYQSQFIKTNTLTVGMNLIAMAMGKQDFIDPQLRTDQAVLHRHMELGRKLKDQLINWVLQGQLISIGYQSPRKAADDPISIPLDMWTQRVNWEKNQIEGNGLVIEGVRILHPNWIKGTQRQLANAIKENDISQEKPEFESRNPGRPSSRDLIIHAYIECQNIGWIDFDKSMDLAIKTIQEWISRNYEKEYKGGKGFSKETIRRLITDDFKHKSLEIKQP